MSGKDTDDTVVPCKTNHPDSHEMDDWFHYVPKDIRIAELVNELVILHGMRIAEVENLLLKTLRKKKCEF